MQNFCVQENGFVNAEIFVCSLLWNLKQIFTIYILHMIYSSDIEHT